MTNEEIKTEIKKLESQKFFINMADRLSDKDYDTLREIDRKLDTYREQLKEAQDNA